MHTLIHAYMHAYIHACIQNYIITYTDAYVHACMHKAAWPKSFRQLWKMRSTSTRCMAARNCALLHAITSKSQDRDHYGLADIKESAETALVPQVAGIRDLLDRDEAFWLVMVCLGHWTSGFLALGTAGTQAGVGFKRVRKLTSPV